MLIREGGASDPYLAIRYVPGERRPEIWIIDPRWKARSFGNTGAIRLLLRPDAGEPVGRFLFLPVGKTGRYALAAEDGGEDFLDRFSRANAVGLQRKDGEILSIATPGAAKAVAAVRACEDNMLRAWGMDPVVYRSLRERPKPINVVQWLAPSDYPDSAVREGVSGASVTRLNVTAEGKVTSCAVVVPSGSPDLDKATCSGALRRGRYEPAVAADGRKVASLVIFVVRWQIFG